MTQELAVFISGGSGEASRALQCLKERSALVARNAVALIRNRAGEVSVFESGDVESRHLLHLAAVAGLLVELWGRSGTERTLVTPWSDAQLATLSAELPVDGSALVILIDGERQGLLDCLASFQGRVSSLALADDVLVRLASSESERR